VDWVEQELRSTRGKRAIDLAAKMWVEENKLDYDLLGAVYRPKQKIPGATVNRFLKQERVSSAVNDKIIEILSKNGINEDFIIEKRKKAIEIAEDKERPDWIDTHVSAFEDMLEMKPKLVKQINTISETRKLTTSDDVGKAITATQQIEERTETEKPESNDGK